MPSVLHLACLDMSHAKLRTSPALKSTSLPKCNAPHRPDLPCQSGQHLTCPDMKRSTSAAKLVGGEPPVTPFGFVLLLLPGPAAAAEAGDSESYPRERKVRAEGEGEVAKVAVAAAASAAAGAAFGGT